MSGKFPPGAKWLPSDYMDDIVPPARESPSAWLSGSADAGWHLASSEEASEEAPDRPLVEGDVVQFHFVVGLSTVTLTITDDDGEGERTWHTSPAPPLIAPPGTSLTIYDGESLWLDIDEAAKELDEGEHELEAYCWSDRSVAFRFTDGRFEEVRQDA